MSAGKSSAVAAVAAELGTGEAHTPAPDAVGDLFADLDRETAQFADATIKPPEKRGPGRPPGPSRTTRQLQMLLRAGGYRDPAEFLASVFSMSTLDLARDLGVEDREKVLAIQVKAAGELMPYFHAKTPVAIEHVGDGGRPLVVIMDGERGAATMRQRDAMSIHDVEYQEVSSASAARSHDGGSHDPAKDEQSQCVSDGQADD